MTHAASRRPGGSAWLFPVMLLLGIWVASLFGFLSRSIVVDFVSWWPVWILLLGIGLAVRGRHIGKPKASGVMATASAAVIVVLLVGHIQGWPIMASSVAGLSGGVDQGVETAAVSARLGDGVLRVGPGGAGLLYAAEPLRGGGDVALPQATERSQGVTISIELTPVADPGWYLFRGWHVVLSPGPSWSINLQGVVEADFDGIRVESLQLEGSGSAGLGVVDTNVPVSVAGEFVIDLPRGQAARVIGMAEVPEDWVRNESGTLSPIEGEGWIISVAGGSVVRIRYR